MFPSGCRAGWVFLALLWLAPTVLLAGGGSFNTLVVVNTNSADSVELGDYYAAAHGIPAHHICTVGIDTNLATLTSNEFYSLLRSPITNHIAAHSLGGQIDFLVLCQDFPTRVRDVEGVTASLFYGFKNAPGYNEGGIGCNMPAYTSNAYYRAERAFRSADGWNSTNGFVAFHLIASNLPTAKLVVDRGAAAQSSFPSSSIYLHMLGSAGRSVREQRHAHTQFSFTALPGLPVPCVLAPLYSNLSGQTNVIGYQDGYGTIQSIVRTNNTWLNGAYSDHFTSYGGRIPTNPLNQSTVLDWMQIGATASYGTVAEPCNYLEKFPDPLMAFYYARGFTIGECYAMAVEAPYQGLFAGDPLAAPFAAPPTIAVTSQVPYQIVTGTIPVQVSATARSNGVPAAALDLYLDGRFSTHLATLGPTPSNRLSIVVAARTNSATVATNHSLFDAVAALADAVNADSNQIVTATATGDRLELIYKAFDHAGDYAVLSAAVSQGNASGLTLGVGLAATNLAPSIYPARKRLWLYAHTSAGANAGDTITNIITLTNGVAVTNILVASQGEKITNLLERLRLAINTNTTLMATNGVRYDHLALGIGNVLNDGTLFARTPGPDGAGIQIDYAIHAVSNTTGLKTNYNFSSFMDNNPDDVRPRAAALFHVRPTNGILAATASVDTTLLADGVHTLDFVARDGSAVAAASRLTLPIVVCNESPQLSVLGTNNEAIADGEAPSLAKGTEYGQIPWGEARTNTFSIHNNGSAPLSITHWTTNGTGAAAFQVSGVPASIAAGGISNFTVVFAPASAGAFQAALAFGSDAVLPKTNLLFAGTGAYTLAIVSDHGATEPPVGLHTLSPGTVLTNSIAVPAPDGGTQLVCTGWTMAGNAPTNGATTNFTMTVTNDADLTWLWTTNFWLDTAAGPNGSVNVADAWQPASSTTQITAFADAYYHFTHWTGSASSTNNPLDLLMDSPKAVQANFAENLAAHDTPEWWLAQNGWTNDFDAAATNDAEPDGFPTWQEYIADTDPNSTNSMIPSLGATGSTNNLAFGIDPTSTGRHYYVDVTTPLDGAPAWTNLTNAAGTGGAWLPELTPPGTGIYFYRGRIALP